MCRLFAMSSKKPVKLDKMFLEFLKLSKVHNDGWGLAVFDNGFLSLAKEPIAAYKSKISQKFSNSVEGKVFLGHLRKASAGKNKYTNTHPFVFRIGEKEWVFAHNGSMYNKYNIPKDKPFSQKVEGDTDSERFFAYIISQMKERGEDNLKDILLEANFMAYPFQDYSIPNKKGGLNYILTDGQKIFVHRKNRTLWYLQEKEKVTICSQPLTKGKWIELEEGKIYQIENGKIKEL